MKKEKNHNETKTLNVQLSHESCESNGKHFDNLFVVTPYGTKFAIKLSFYNRKLLYKIICEIEGTNNG